MGGDVKMFNPQTKASLLSFFKNCLEEIGENGCLAFTYLWATGYKGSEADYILQVAQAMDADLLTHDSWVKDANQLIKFYSGKNADVTKQKISSIENIIEPTPVLFRAPGKEGHWVGVANGKIEFNSLSRSINVEEGAPVEARVIEWL